MKFRLKIMLCMLCLLSVLFGVGGSLMITLSFRDSLERERLSAYNAYQTVLGTLQIVNGINRQIDYKDISGTLEQMSSQSAGSWTALRLYGAGRTIYEDGTFPFSAQMQSRTPASGHCMIQYLPLDDARHFLTVSGTLEAGSETLSMDMACDISALMESQQAQQRVYQGVFLLLAGICAALSYTLSRILTRPLSELSKASKAISAGRLSCRAKVHSGDEIGLVARDFNAMAAHLEENISELKASVERQERFIGSFAHEVKTPMTSIIGYADLIRGQTLDEEEQREAANFIVAEGRRLEHLSQKLLQLLVVKRGDVVLSPARPAVLIEGLAAHLGPLYRAQGIALTCECEDGECLMEPDLIRSLLVNLWDNARKAMEGRGGYIRVKSVMLPDGCRILVQDNGRGIPSDSLEHLTEAFYRVDKSRSRQQGGVGLGLALCQEIISLHNGSIRFESRIDHGTTVIVELKGGK